MPTPSQTNTGVILVAMSLALGPGCERPAPAPSLQDPLAAGWQGSPVCELLHEDARQRMLRCTFPPGVGHERHYHAPHVGYALSDATMRITDEDGIRDQTIPAGIRWVSDGVEWHEVLNTGTTTGSYLIFEVKR